MEGTAPVPGANPKPKRYIKNYIIDSSFQLGWVFRVALVTTLILGVMGYFLYSTLSESTELMVGEALMAEGMSEEAQTAFIEQGEADKMKTILLLAGCLVGLVVMHAVMTIVATHKIAGPAYKMKRLLGDIDGEHLQLWAKLRKGDELVDVFQEFDDMVRRLREARHTDIDELDAISEMIGQGDKDAAASRLAEMITRYRDSVHMD